MLLVLANDELRVVELPKVASQESELVMVSDRLSCEPAGLWASSHFVFIVCMINEVDLRFDAFFADIFGTLDGEWTRSSRRTFNAVRVSAIGWLSEWW